MILPENEVFNLYRNKARTIRAQRCFGCNRVLAFEVSDNIGFEADYWIVDSAKIGKGISEHYFRRCNRWFGNYLKCPSCGRTGRLPMDKPLNWENMEQKRKENANAL